MEKLKKIKLEISIKIHPKSFNDPESAINKNLSKYLFKYSYLKGIPLCYKIIGIHPLAKIVCDNEFLFLGAMVCFCIVSIKIGDVMYSNEGTVFGIVYTKINEQEEYTGNFKITAIENNLEECTTLVGVVV